VKDISDDSRQEICTYHQGNRRRQLKGKAAEGSRRGKSNKGKGKSDEGRGKSSGMLLGSGDDGG